MTFGLLKKRPKGKMKLTQKLKHPYIDECYKLHAIIKCQSFTHIYT